MSLDTEARPPRPEHGAPLAHPLRTSAIVIYATLALLMLTIPRGLVNWSNGLDPSAPQRIVLAVAEAIQAASQRIGADRAYEHARALFLAVTGKREEG